MGQAKQRGTYEERAAAASPRISQRNGRGRFLASRSRFIHISQNFVWNEEKKHWQAVYLNANGGPCGVSYSPHKTAVAEAAVM